jgi:hypothetical protein
MTAAGLVFRATKDLDIVLYVEVSDATFVPAFWQFLRVGGYYSSSLRRLFAYGNFRGNSFFV